jgi:beta-lactam-binding protein with PASTA domain
MVGVENPDDDFTRGPVVTFEVPEPVEKKPFPWKIPAIIAAVALVVIIAAVGFIMTRGGSEQVPSVAASSVIAATEALTSAGFEVAGETREQPSSDVEQGMVAGTDPAEGTEVEKGATITLLVSSGVGNVAVPDVQGMSITQATAALIGAGFTVADGTASAFSSDVESGGIVGSDPPGGEEAAPGSEITIVLSSGPAPTGTPTSTAAPTETPVPTVALAPTETPAPTSTPLPAVTPSPTPVQAVQIPEVANSSVVQAITTLTNAGLVVADDTTEQYDDNVAEGRAAGTIPSANSGVEQGSTVTLLISKGPAPETVLLGQMSDRIRLYVPSGTTSSNQLTYPYTASIQFNGAFVVTEVIVDTDWWYKRPKTITVLGPNGTQMGSKSYPEYDDMICGDNGDVKCEYPGNSVSRMRVNVDNETPVSNVSVVIDELLQTSQDYIDLMGIRVYGYTDG